MTTAFVGASAMYGAAAIYGATTRRSLASIGPVLMMGLIGLLVVSVLNLFLHSSQVSWLSRSSAS